MIVSQHTINKWLPDPTSPRLKLKEDLLDPLTQTDPAEKVMESSKAIRTQAGSSKSRA
jgi:hypothetical protein